MPGQTEENAPLLKTVALLESGAQPVKIVCFGDSITGVYYHTGGRRAYPDMVQIALERIYPKAKVTVVNAGVSGHTTRNALARIDRDVLAHKPDLVTVMFGMNDLARLPLAEFQTNLVEIVGRCRKAGAEVVLCTQNDVIEPGRSRKKLAEITAAIHEVGKKQKVRVADCNRAYADVRAGDELEFALLMSDEVHPNMDGHKLLAVEIARAISGKKVTLADAGPPTPAIPRTLALLKAGKTIRVLAMPPYDKLIGPALRKVQPSSKADVVSWPTAGQTLAQIEKAATKVRGMKLDLVLIAVPADADAKPIEKYIRSYTWVMNWSLSFDYQKWDCMVMPPSTARAALSPMERERDRLARRLIAAQDLSMVVRPAGDKTSAEELLVRWLRGQVRDARGLSQK